MILIADSGSTKCDWALITSSGEKKASFSTMGLNPYFHDENVVEKALLSVNGESELFKNVEQVYFYGAGASSPTLCATIERGLARVFPNASLLVDHDLLGAAYATYDGRPAITCILGTGSNSCFFDGQKVREEVPSLAFILGDEGSGSYFGKKLIREYFYKRLPQDIHDAFEKTYGLTHDQLVDRVYNQPNANVFLASFMKFIGAFKEHPHVKAWMNEGLKEFLDIHVCCYPEHKEVPIHFVGSIGHFFRESLEQAVEEMGLTMGNLVRKPIDGLITYHVKYKITA